MNNMTALISCFARYYHTKNSNVKIYNDTFAKDILTKTEIEDISKNMANGINFFSPNYEGDNPLEYIVHINPAPQVLARFIFNEYHLLNMIKLGLKQYVVFASGYDISAYKVNNRVEVFESDKKGVADDNDVDNNYFYDYNNCNPNNKIVAPIGVSYVLMVKNK